MLDTKRKNNTSKYDRKALTFPIVDQTVKTFDEDQKTKTIKPKPYLYISNGMNFTRNQGNKTHPICSIALKAEHLIFHIDESYSLFLLSLISNRLLMN